MSNRDSKISQIIRKAVPRTPGGAAESRLDSLLASKAKQDSSQAAPDASNDSSSKMDQVRRVFQTQLVPAFDELIGKYQPQGVFMEMDASGFLNGGRNVRVVIEYQGAGVRLEGVVMPNAIAFTETRYSASDPAGVAASGPSLRTRDLGPNPFRDFVCDRMTSLIQSVLKQKS